MNYLLFEKVVQNEIRPVLRRNKLDRYFISLEKDILTGKEVKKIAEQIKYLLNIENNNNSNVLIRIRINSVDDMPVVCILEMYIYELVCDRRFNVRIQLDFDDSKTINKYLEGSWLYKYNYRDVDYEDVSKIMTSTVNQITRNSFRKNIKLDKDIENTLNFLYQDSMTFFKHISFNNLVITALSEIISELSINMAEHGKNDFTVIINVDETYKISDSKDFGDLVSITIFNLSECKLYTSLKEIVYENKLKDTQKNLYHSKDYHKEFYRDGYDENLFYMISSFQRNISSRIEDNKVSGTGLTTVLKEIMENSSSSSAYSYVLSGESIVFFMKDLIAENEIDGYLQIGFNESGKYRDDIPSNNSYNSSSMYYNGTIFYSRLFIER